MEPASFLAELRGAKTKNPMPIICLEYCDGAGECGSGVMIGD